MTVADSPAAVRSPAAHTESVAVRMARVTWYRHRGALAGIAALFALAVVVLLAEGLTMRHTLGGLSRCLVTDAHGSVCARHAGLGRFRHPALLRR